MCLQGDTNTNVNTKVDEIYHMFLNSVKDPTIKKLFDQDINIADDLLETFLLKAIPKFDNCVKNIEEINVATREFPCFLDLKEKNIIVEWMIVEWLDWVTNDIRQMGVSLNDNDFKHHAADKNLAGKSKYANDKREIVSQDMVMYGFKHTPFKEWALGNYGI